MRISRELEDRSAPLMRRVMHFAPAVGGCRQVTATSPWPLALPRELGRVVMQRILGAWCAGLPWRPVTCSARVNRQP